MSILDDAIREHLELKRAHGADEGELKKLEDEAFGPPQRPDEIDPFNEAPTEFLLSPSDTAADGPEVGDEATRGGRRPNITDLQEAPPAEPVTGEADAASDEGEALATRESDVAPAPDAPPPSPADVPLPPPPADEQPAAAAPAEEEQPVGEHEIVADAEVGPDTDERHVIADQPTQMFDVQAQMDAEVPEAPAEQESPSDDELVDAAQGEPQAAPPAPDEGTGPPTELYEQQPLDTRGPDAEVAGHPPTEEESAEFDFFNEQRLSDELDQALEAPLTAEHELPPLTDEHDIPAPIAEPSAIVPENEDDDDEEPLRPDYDPDTGHEDVLEDTPDFLEDAPEDDKLWFEQKPPKDFDFDD